MAEHFANDIATTLNGAINNSVTSVVVTSNTGFPTSNFRVRVEDELMLVTANGSTTWTVTRGVEGTTAASHADTTAVTHVLTNVGLTTYVAEQIALQLNPFLLAGM